MPFPHLAAISRKNKIHTQIQFPERPWRNENLFGFQEYHLCPDPRHFLIDSGGRGQSDECINLLSPMFAWLSDQPVISPGWPGLADHGAVYPGRGQTNTGLDHLTSNTSLLVIVLHRRRHTYFDSHGQSITQKAWDNMWHCVWHWGCWHWSLDGARWPWYWPWGPGVWPHWLHGVTSSGQRNNQGHEETNNEAPGICLGWVRSGSSPSQHWPSRYLQGRANVWVDSNLFNQRQIVCHSLVHHLIELLKLPNRRINVYWRLCLCSHLTCVFYAKIRFNSWLLKVTAIYVDGRCRAEVRRAEKTVSYYLLAGLTIKPANCSIVPFPTIWIILNLWSVGLWHFVLRLQWEMFQHICTLWLL